MFRNYQLKPITVHGKPISFEWNPETRELRGNNADLVEWLANMALRSGYLTGHPYPTDHEITDPLHLPAEMAVVLGNEWILPDDLQAAYPKPDDDDLITEIDGAGVEHPLELQPLY